MCRSAHDSLSGLTAEEELMIRGSLIKFYMGTEGTYQELHALLSFLFDVDDEPVVSVCISVADGVCVSAKNNNVFKFSISKQLFAHFDANTNV